MAQSERRARAYAARDARARALGWTGYGQQRQAARLGYSTPAQYHGAKSARPAVTAPIEPSPFVKRRGLAGGGVVGNYSGRIGIEVPYTPPAVAALERELRRYRGNRRIHLWIGDASIFRGGASLSWFQDQYASGELFDYLAELAADAYEFTGTIEHVSITIS